MTLVAALACSSRFASVSAVVGIVRGQYHYFVLHHSHTFYFNVVRPLCDLLR
jgi:hypothetical protein